ncbi:recombinase family protein [uncultured Holdemania sp.]|uniref:recombinase family protein n=1 Tax=uncultured Holdemania sp. TaxID=527664 RepID=UPI0025D68549|nr:recombinase family protein [uncultured Holdemania sp.]
MKNVNYGYARVSSRSQNLDRQIEELKAFGLTESQLYIDQQSGKDFDRQAYRQLKEVLRPQDLLVIKSIDRLGRNYQAILEEWADLTKRQDVQIVVLDMPLLDTRSRPDNLVGCFISDLVLQILSFVAENERINIKTRQAEGIRIAKEKGKHLGRPRYIPPENFSLVAARYLRHECTLQQALDQLQIKKSTFYKYIRNLDAV